MPVDLNCDMGELDDGARETALMRCITSANIACGAHAGTSEIAARTIRLAREHGVRIGAHPGYPDRAGFGRVEMPITPGELEQTITEQVRYLESFGAPVEYVKLHGALYNVAARDEVVARTVGRAVARWRPGALMFGLAGSQALDIWRGMGLAVAAEGFAERRYELDGSLRHRRFPDAIIHDPAEAAAQALALARSGRVQTICVHGDSPRAVEVMQAVAQALGAELR
jgi:5-oxoprolinase (ATP-hydrolysing) subunit A